MKEKINKNMGIESSLAVNVIRWRGMRKKFISSTNFIINIKVIYFFHKKRQMDCN